MTGQVGHDPTTWRPQDRFTATIGSLRQLRAFNETGGIAVNFDVMRAASPEIAIEGSQSATLSLWETRSASGFITKPKFNAALVTIRFVTSGQILYRHRRGLHRGSPTHATLVGFEDLTEVEASAGFGAISGTIGIETLVAANEALTGGAHHGLPRLAPIADVASPGMMALFCTIRQVHRRVREMDRRGDLIFPLIQEVMSYQLLSAWPRRGGAPASGSGVRQPRGLRVAMDYIEANLSEPLTLSEIAAVAGMSVRSLQDRFRKDLGLTPVRFIIDQRLTRAHRDLLAPGNDDLSIAEIARRWGFTHVSDFGQRYRRLFGCTPSQTRLEAPRGH